MTKGLKSRADLRKLIYFPIIHTQTDMGGLSDSLRRMTVRKLGKRAWERQVVAVDKMWTEIERTTDRFDFSTGKVRLYQDGLPVCGREADIVRGLAEAGSRNHQLLLRLMEKGATIMGTESAELLVEEYELVKQVLDARDAEEAGVIETRLKTLSQSLLKRRDRYIAGRINSTLLPGETGILFLGMLHSLEEVLARDIKVIYPILRRPDHGDQGDDQERRPGFDRRR